MKRAYKVYEMGFNDEDIGPVLERDEFFWTRERAEARATEKNLQWSIQRNKVFDVDEIEIQD